MKILLISDVHANIQALRAVEEAEKSWDAVWCLGDMVEYGFHPHETVQWLKEHDALAVMGNHDARILNAIDSGIHPLPLEKATNFRDYTIGKLTQEDIDWLRTLPEQRVVTADGYTYCLTHYYTDGEYDSCWAPFEALKCYDSFNRFWEKKAGAVEPGQKRRILFGHSHQAVAMPLRPDMAYLNPGSLAYRCGNDCHYCKGADYMVIEDGVFSFKHVDYDTAPLLEILKKSSLVGIEWDVAEVFSTPPREAK